MPNDWPHIRAMLMSKPMVYTPWRNSDVVTTWPSPVRARSTRAALIIAAPVMAAEWSPMPPRWKGSGPPGVRRDSAMPARAQKAATS